MKILEINTAWPHPDAKWWWETYFANFVKELSKDIDVKLTIMVNNYRKSDFKLINLINNFFVSSNVKKKWFLYVLDNKINVILPNPIMINLWKLSNAYNPIPIYLINPIWVINFFRFLRNEKFDFIHIHNLRTRTNISIVFILNVYFFIFWKKETKIILTDHNVRARPWPKYFIDSVDILCLVSRSSYDAIKRWTNNLTNHIWYIYWWYDKSVFYNKWLTRDIDVIYISRIVPEKWADVLINAISVLNNRWIFPNVYIWWPVSWFMSNYYEDLKNMSLRLKLENTTIESRSFTHEEMNSLFNRSKIFVLPSVSIDLYWKHYFTNWNCSELFPLVLLEAWWSWCSIVSSNIPWTKELYQYVDSRLMFESNNAEDLADKIQNTLNGDIDYWCENVIKNNFQRHNVISRFKNVIKEGNENW
jgi:glycosyltransferase involved in cell wall biosynthesis